MLCSYLRTVVVGLGATLVAQPCPTDPTFGLAGVAVVDLGGDDVPRCVMIQPDGKIVVGGRSNGSLALVRLLPNGTLDPSFGQNGIVSGTAGAATDVVLARGPFTSGTLLVCVGPDAEVRRYTPNGTLDASFGNAGRTLIPASMAAAGIGELADGSVVAGGDCCASAFRDPEIATARYLFNGLPDIGYSSGSAWRRYGQGDIDSNIVVEPGDTFLGAGISRALISSTMLVVRFNRDGSVRCSTTLSFGGTYDRAFAVARQPDGKILAGGNAQNLGASALARLTDACVADPSFGNNGLVTTVGAPTIATIGLQSDGKIVVNGAGNFGVRRYMPTGAVDTGFGTNGTITCHVVGATADLAVQADDKIVVVGAIHNGRDNDFCVVRYGGAGVTASASVYGCGVNPAQSMTVIGGRPQIGSVVVLGVDNPLGTQAPATTSAVLFLSAFPSPAFPCGTRVPGWGMAGANAPGELLLTLTSFLALPGAPWSGPGIPVPFALPVPAFCGWMGLTVFCQGAMFDPPAMGGVAVGLTDAVELRIGDR